MFIRKKKNRSGTISVIVVDKSRGKFREVKKFGVASTDEEADALVKDAQLWLHRYGGMQYLDFDGTDKTEADIDYALTHIIAYVKLYITYLESARAIWRRDLCSTERRIEAHVCICFIAYKVYKELQRLLPSYGIDISVDKVLKIAKAIPTVYVKLPNGKIINKTLFLTDEQGQIKPLFDM